jgi:DNA invertase Pin-like site-specific DNA recombinase
MLIGYARTSTVEQQAGLEAQGRDLKVFSEQTSAVGRRRGLETALDYVREGDVLVVTKLDRLARSVADLCAIVEKIERKGASLRILAMNLDTATPTGRLMVNVIGSVSQFEREMMLERQREAVQRAKREGKYRGRKPIARAKSAEIVRLAGEGVRRAEIAKRLGIGVASVYRVLAKERAALLPQFSNRRLTGRMGPCGASCVPLLLTPTLRHWTQRLRSGIIPSSHVGRGHGCRRVASRSRARPIRDEFPGQ